MRERVGACEFILLQAIRETDLLAPVSCPSTPSPHSVSSSPSNSASAQRQPGARAAASGSGGACCTSLPARFAFASWATSRWLHPGTGFGAVSRRQYLGARTALPTRVPGPGAIRYPRSSPGCPAGSAPLDVSHTSIAPQKNYPPRQSRDFAPRTAAAGKIADITAKRQQASP